MTNEELLIQVSRINAELDKEPLVVPSKFWESHGTEHINLLLKYGIERRTI